MRKIMNNTELKIKAYNILSQQLGLVEMERFISLVQLEKFDYTKWRKDLFDNFTVDDLSKQAMKNRTQFIDKQ